VSDRSAPAVEGPVDHVPAVMPVSEVAHAYITLSAVGKRPVVARRAQQMRLLAASAALDELRAARPVTYAALSAVLRLLRTIESRCCRNRMKRSAIVVCLAPLLVRSGIAREDELSQGTGAVSTAEELAASATRSIGRKIQVAGALLDAAGVDGHALQAAMML